MRKSTATATIVGVLVLIAAQSATANLIPHTSGPSDYTFTGAGQFAMSYSAGRLPITGVITSQVAIGAYQYNPASPGNNLTNRGGSATILDGYAASGGTATMQWRTRSPEETWEARTSPPLPSTGMALCDDLVQVGGINGTFVLDMNYVEDPAIAQAAYNAGGLYVAWMKDNATWVNAAKQMQSAGASAANNFSGSYQTFATNNGINGTNIDQYVGSWGVDLLNHDAWAILKYDLTSSPQQFGVVPEPGTLSLLAAGLLAALTVTFRRWKGFLGFAR